MYPTIVDFGPISMHSYSLMVALAFLLVWSISQREFSRKGLSPRPTPKIVFAAAVGGIVGAKLYSAFQDGEIERAELLSMSGLVWYGGVIGALPAVLFVIHRSPNPILPTLDTLAVLVLLGYGIGRIGCFLAGDGDYGPPSDVPWAMAFPNGTEPTSVRVHPTPLYETAMSLGAFGVLWSIRKRKEQTPGWLAGVALILAGIERFIAEVFRLNVPVLVGLTEAQITSIVFVIVGGALVCLVRASAYCNRVQRPAPTSNRSLGERNHHDQRGRG